MIVVGPSGVPPRLLALRKSPDTLRSIRLSEGVMERLLVTPGDRNCCEVFETRLVLSMDLLLCELAERRSPKARRDFNPRSVASSVGGQNDCESVCSDVKVGGAREEVGVVGSASVVAELRRKV